MELSIRHLEIFRALMHAGSVTAAARLLHTSQPTVSREIARMEQMCGLTLFERSGGRLNATAQALMLFEEVERSYVGLERVRKTAEAIRRFEHGQLTLSCLPLFSQTIVPRASSAFRRKHPHIGISVTAQESPLLEESLSGQRHDLGLVEGDGALGGTSMHRLLVEDMVCVLPSGHVLAAKAVLTLADFQGVDFINLSGLDVYRQRVDDCFHSAGVERHVTVETNNSASVCAMVRHGLGVTIMNPLSALEEAGRGVEVRRLAVSIPYQVVLVRAQHRPASAFVEAYCGQLQASAAQLSVELKKVLG